MHFLAIVLLLAQASPCATQLCREIGKGRLTDLRWPDFADFKSRLNELYAPAGYALLWTENGRPTGQAQAVVKLFETSDLKGLSPEDYDASRWPARLAHPEPVYFDLALSVCLLRYLADLHFGKSNAAFFHVDSPREDLDLPGFIRGKVLSSTNLTETVAEIEPRFAAYWRTQKVLADYLARATEPQRILQLRLSLERWRWIPHNFKHAPIVVNIPEFSLRALNPALDTELEMNVVVGSAYEHQTPTFAADLTFITFRPYWHVPRSILLNEMASKIAADRNYLTDHRYEVVNGAERVVTREKELSDRVLRGLMSGRYSLRQIPGPNSALGLLRFGMPNEHNVYLHDTPTHLFDRSRRDFSHGCVRVEHPVQLAEWALPWPRRRILAAMNGHRTFQVKLAQPIPVVILYATAVVLKSGEARFVPDIYGQDLVLENRLAQGYPSRREL